MYDVTLRRIWKTLLPWKNNKYYILVCVCMGVPGHVGMCMGIYACSLANPACNAYAPCCDIICGPLVATTFFNIIS
jgi:hypothetical protein